MSDYKIIKSFNIEKYNEKVTELERAIKIINMNLYNCMVFGMEVPSSPDFIQEWLDNPMTTMYSDVLSLKNVSKVEIPWVMKEFNDPEAILNLMKEAIGIVNRMTEDMSPLIEILPYVKGAYGILFTLADDWKEQWEECGCVITKTKDAERLIMEQCVEYEEMYMSWYFTPNPSHRAHA